jgi:hypothetical protein
MPLEIILIGVVIIFFVTMIGLKLLPLRISVPLMLVALAVTVAAGLTEYSVRKGYCNKMGADITRVRRQLSCTNGIRPPPVDWARLLGF